MAEYHGIIAEATRKGLKDVQVMEYLKELKNQGDICEIKSGYYRVT